MLADLLERVNGRGGYNMGFFDDAPCTAPACERQNLVEAFYVRLRLEDRAGALAKVSWVLANANISAHSPLQDASDGALSDLIVVTHPVSDAQLHETLPKLQDAAGPGHSVVVYPALEDAGVAA